MKQIKSNRVRISFPGILCLVLLLAASCTNEHVGSNEKDENDAIISFSLKAASSSINEDKVLWEDRVDELRMIVFNSSSDEVVSNQKIYFPNGFANRSQAFVLTPGTYDFYFIANESAYTQDFVSALASVSNKSQFTTDSQFSNLQYDPRFIPDETSSAGRFGMSAIYTNISIVSGGTVDNPITLPIPGDKVELIRALAKIEVIFRKKIAGSHIPANTITSVQLANVASRFSVPPVDDYYNGQTTTSALATLTGFNYDEDSIGTVTFFVPEFLIQEGNSTSTELHLNNKVYPIETDVSKVGLLLQRRSISSVSNKSVIRNYHYIVNAYINGEGGIQIKAFIEPWSKNEYQYLFQGDKQVIIPPVDPTDSSIVITPLCDEESRIEILDHQEILPQGLQGAFGDEVIYWDPTIGGPTIKKGQEPYYCEKKYGKGWRLINSCELMSFLAVFDQAYRVWQSNTWEGVNNNLPFYPLPFRQQAQILLQKLTGTDLSGVILSDDGKDNLGDVKLGMIDRYFTPGDIVLKEEDFPNGWPFDAPPMNSGQKWYPSEVVVQVKAYWYPDYYDLSTIENQNKELYQEFQRYDYSSTVSRCVRVIE